MKNWRPITVLNSKYKLLSSVYTNRLKKVIDTLVGCQQKGFSSIRQAHEVLLNLSHDIHERVGESKASCGISFDFAAAFDTIDHNYIYAIMHLFDFPKKMEDMLKVN